MTCRSIFAACLAAVFLLTAGSSIVLAQEADASQLLMQISRERDPNKKLDHVNSFLERFPDHELKAKLITAKADLLARLNRPDEAIALLEESLKTAPVMEMKLTLAGIYSQKGEKLDRAETLAREVVAENRNMNDNEKPNGVTPEQWQSMKQQILGYSLRILGVSLVKQGKLDARSVVAETMQYIPDYRLLLDTVDLIRQKENPEQAYSFLDGNLVQHRIDDPKILENHRTLYREVKGSESGYDSYMETVRNEWKEIEKADLKKNLLNTECPTFTLKTFDDKSFDNASIKGKKVVINFWASWCGPCKQELPEFEKAFKALAGHDVIMLAVSTEPDGSRKAVDAYLAKNTFTFPVAMNSSMAQAFGVSSIPHTVFIDSTGKIQHRINGFDPRKDLTEQFRNILGVLK